MTDTPGAGLSWSVYAGADEIATITDRPGAPASSALVRAAAPAAVRPVTLCCYSANHEHALGTALRTASSLADLLARVDALGFRVERNPAE